MDTSNAVSNPPSPTPERSTPGLTATGSWLGSQANADEHRGRKVGSAFSVSVILHAALFLLIGIVFAVKPDLAKDLQNQVIDVVFLPQPGPGGGGGGSPAPAPKKPEVIPPHKAPAPVPTPTPVPVVPPPTLQAAVVTQDQTALQAMGANSVSLAQYAGGGSGGGVGSGHGNGVGPGEGGGFGGGAYRPGNGITWPVPIREVKPEYTADAMRAKIQGEVWVDATVKADGTVGDVKIVRSLDKVYGLDQQALLTAKKWLFRPGTDRTGKPVATIVTLQLAFAIH